MRAGAKYREQDPNQTPHSSLHGGNAFAPTGSEQEEEVKEEMPAIEPPKAMRKNLSIGSFMWDWGQQRPSPTSTPGNSTHQGTAFADMAAMKEVVPKEIN